MTGGIFFADGVAVYCFARRQGVQSTSSGEAEVYGASTVAFDGRLLKHILEWCGFKVIYKLHVDSSAAKALMQRSGVGKVKHIDVRSLWLQAERELHGMVVCKTPGEQNPADLGTKVHGRVCFQYLRELVGIVDCSVVAERPLNEIAALSWDVVVRRKPPMRLSGSAGLMKKLLMMSSLAGAAAIDTVQVAASSDGELSGTMNVSLILDCAAGFLFAMMIYPV